MKNYFSKSLGDLQKISQLDLSVLDEKLDTISKNVLYITYKVDKISKYQATLDKYVPLDKEPEEVETL